MKKWLLKPPQYGDFLRLLMAWRVWVAGALVGAIVAALVFAVVPAQYRARATVLVDQNAEQVLPPDNSDRQVAYYLQRETDKLVEVAWADSTLDVVSTQTGISVINLRNGLLHLTQSGDGGWHFFADAPDGATASAIAVAWARSFYSALQDRGPGVSPSLEASLSQVEDLPILRKVSMGASIFSGALIGAMLLAFLLLFFDRKEESIE